MRIVKLFLKYLYFGVSMACVIFMVNSLGLYFVDREGFAVMMEEYDRQLLGTVLVGISCGTTAVIYKFRRPSLGVKVLIHFIVGMGVFYPTALYLGWIPFYPDKLVYTVIQFLSSCVIFVAIWFMFFLSGRKEAGRINARLRELEKETETGRE